MTMANILRNLVAFVLFGAAGIVHAQREIVVYLHPDTNGSPVVATDAGGNVLWKERYAPYGERQVKADDGRNTLWYTGKGHEADTGLSYLGARWYEPVLGRFAGVDPVSFAESNPQSFNRYAYGNNNPYKYKDPDGNAPTPIEAFFTSMTVGEFFAVGALNIYGRLTGDRGLTEATSAAFGGAALAVAQDVAGLASPIPGAAPARRAANLADRAGDTAARGEMILYRYREGSEGTKRLADQAAAAEKAVGVHGVSVTSKPQPGRACAGAKCSDIEKYFPVHKTRKDPNHYTVELPKPVTRQDTDNFNRLFQHIER